MYAVGTVRRIKLLDAIPHHDIKLTTWDALINIVDLSELDAHRVGRPFATRNTGMGGWIAIHKIHCETQFLLIISKGGRHIFDGQDGLYAVKWTAGMNDGRLVAHFRPRVNVHAVHLRGVGGRFVHKFLQKFPFVRKTQFLGQPPRGKVILVNPQFDALNLLRIEAVGQGCTHGLGGIALPPIVGMQHVTEPT